MIALSQFSFYFAVRLGNDFICFMATADVGVGRIFRGVCGLDRFKIDSPFDTTDFVDCVDKVYRV
jgi:hypothetical protein